MKLPITAIVVVCNEAHLLENCLKSIEFCDEIIVIDLESQDNPKEYTDKFNAIIVIEKRVEAGEGVRYKYVDKAKNDWILFIDPDERFPLNQTNNIFNIIKQDTIGVISWPWQFYFKGRRLNYSRWGVAKWKQNMFNKKRAIVSSHVHSGIKPVKEFKYFQVKRTRDNYIKHYWMSSYKQLFEKHKRYIALEGRERYERGERFSWGRYLLSTLKAIKVGLIDTRGIINGFDGIFLAFFWMWYVGATRLSLRKYQKQSSVIHKD